jgi:hypothetical protein
MGGMAERCAVSGATAVVAVVVAVPVPLPGPVSDEELIAPCTTSTRAAAATATPRPMKSPLFDFLSDAGSSRLSSALRDERMTGATRCGAGAGCANAGATNAGEANGDVTGAGAGAGAGRDGTGCGAAWRRASISADVMLRSMMTDTSGSCVSTRCGGAWGATVRASPSTAPSTSICAASSPFPCVNGASSSSQEGRKAAARRSASSGDSPDASNPASVSSSWRGLSKALRQVAARGAAGSISAKSVAPVHPWNNASRRLERLAIGSTYGGMRKF